MIRTRGRKILRDIWARKARTALVAVSIFIGVFGTVTLFSMGDLTVRQLKKDLDQNKLAMIRSYLSVPPGVQPDNEQVLTTLRAVPDTTAVEGQMVYPFFWKKIGADKFQSSTIFSYSEPLDQIQLEPMRLMKGRFPDPGHKEIVVEQRFAKHYGLGVGDQIVVRVLGGAEQNGGAASEETWTIVGTVFFPYGYGGFTPVLPENTVFAALPDAQYITGFTSFTSLYVRYKDYLSAQIHSEGFDQVVTSASNGAYIPVFTFTEDPAKNSAITFIETSGNVMAILALLALVVSGFLVFNVLTAIVTEQRQQIGVMKSVGASQTDNFLIYSGMALIYGIMGVVPGVLLGIPVGFVAARGFAQSSNFVLDKFAISTPAVVLGIVVGLAVPVLASLLPVFNGTRVSIREALTDLGISASYGQGPLARLVQRLPVPITVRQGISNVIRKKGRIVLTVITLTLAAGAFMGVFAVFNSVSQVLNEFFNAYTFQLTVEPKDISQLDQAETLVLDHFPDLTSKGPYTSLAVKIDGFDKEFNPAAGPPALFASGYDPATGAFDLKLVAGESLAESPNGVVISQSIADWIHKGVGDTITIHAGGRSGEYQIVGITSFPYDGVWFKWDDLARLGGFVTPDGTPVPSGWAVVINQKGHISAADVQDKIDAINELLMSNGIAASYGNIELFKEQISNAVATFQMLFNFAALLIALVGAVGLLTTLSMSVYERQKEIGVMRSIGAGSLAIIGQFMTEGLVVGLLAWLIGLPLSYVLNNGLIAALNLGKAYNLGYPPAAAVLGLVGTLIITALASLWPSLSAARKTVSNILRYQ
jgi:putative ABC transport system permease protein